VYDWSARCNVIRLAGGRNPEAQSARIQFERRSRRGYTRNRAHDEFLRWADPEKKISSPHHHCYPSLIFYHYPDRFRNRQIEFSRRNILRFNSVWYALDIYLEVIRRVSLHLHHHWRCVLGCWNTDLLFVNVPLKTVLRFCVSFEDVCRTMSETNENEGSIILLSIDLFFKIISTSALLKCVEYVQYDKLLQS